MQNVSFSVRGETKVVTANSKIVFDWRRTLGTIALSKRNEHKYKQPDRTSLFDVTIRFHLDKRSFLKCDLDNLAKPVLDTLFCSLKKPTKDSVLENTLFDIGDHGIQKLSLEKCLADSSTEFGVDVNISW